MDFNSADCGLGKCCGRDECESSGVFVPSAQLFCPFRLALAPCLNRAIILQMTQVNYFSLITYSLCFCCVSSLLWIAWFTYSERRHPAGLA